MSTERSEFLTKSDLATVTVTSLIPYTFDFAAELVAVSLALGTAGSTTTTVDVWGNGSTLFTAPNSTLPSLVAAATTKVLKSAAATFASGSTVTPVDASTLTTTTVAGKSQTILDPGTDYILPTYPDSGPIATVAAGTLILPKVTAAGTSAANLSVVMHWVKL